MLKVTSLNKSYEQGKKVFESISFSLPAGSFVSLTGKNGIGKTTLLNILAGLTSFEGEIVFADICLQTSPGQYEKYVERYIAKTAYIPNDPFLYPYLTLSEMVELLLTVSERKQPPTYLQDLLEELALTEYEHVLIKNMSLGTQQKAAIVTAYLDEPQLILMDEPFVNFDQKSLKVILRFIRDYLLQRQAITIFSTHSQDHRIQQVITHNLHIKDARTITVTEKRNDRDVRDVFV